MPAITTELAGLRACAARLDREYDAAERIEDWDALERISREQVHIDEEIEEIEDTMANLVRRGLREAA